jgi:hypothetical protein
MPAPGSYDIEKMDSMFKRVQNKIQEASLNPAIAFGSFTDRFKHKAAVTFLLMFHKCRHWIQDQANTISITKSKTLNQRTKNPFHPNPKVEWPNCFKKALHATKLEICT